MLTMRKRFLDWLLRLLASTDRVRVAVLERETEELHRRLDTAARHEAEDLGRVIALEARVAALEAARPVLSTDDGFQGILYGNPHL